MEGRKLDTQGTNNPEVANRRNLFDRHMDECRDCQPSLCTHAQVLWRDVCLTALRSFGVN